MDRKHQFKRKSESASVMREKRRRERRGTSCHHRVLFQTLGPQQSGHAKDAVTLITKSDQVGPNRTKSDQIGPSRKYTLPNRTLVKL